MDNAVALIRAYLQLNGYYTITEYPVVRKMGEHQYRTLTDVDVIGFRFPYGDREFTPDEALQVPSDKPDMIIGEVKEGRAVINETVNEPDVMTKVLRRFGGCDATEANHLARLIVQKGSVESRAGMRIRLVSFGSSVDAPGPHHRIALSDVVRYIDQYIEKNWDAVKTSGSKDPVFGFLVMLAKARGNGSKVRRAK